MDERAFDVVRQLAEHVDAGIPRGIADQATYARELFDLLVHEGGTVEPLGDPEYFKTRKAELGTWTDDPWGDPTYGVDASTTRPLEYNNGLVVDTAHAKLGVGGANADRGPEQRGTIVTGVYLEDDDVTLHQESIERGDVAGEIIRIPEMRQRANVTSILTSTVQRLAEGKHARRCLDDVDGPLFLDGSVYPLSVIYWTLLDRAGQGAPIGEWDLPTTVIENYVAVVDACYDRDLPVLGVVKTSSMGELTESLREKIAQNNLRGPHGTLRDVPWLRDHQFIGEVLRDSSLDHITYTSWFVQTEVELRGESFDLLEAVAGDLSHGGPSDYRRAFCYVRTPKTGNVFRVETPALFLTDDDRREQVRLKALKEIARKGDVPGAVARADRIARISPGNRETIRDSLQTVEPAFDYNRDGRWSHLEDSRSYE
ncbi:DNA double-strand break repair nuclease NurA [Halosimplex pelagicum]|uniref:DNA double-strand break repair nuclease NurA n=1 Tax=Halosimplex pelagicum TaxID=869886 RepID=A0A7D5TDC7_9EURY|nr:DNA double-strand break repair nuclease NurA [Halosimplex pelagicum]QLH83813.1 DNA double-strand break repair nuclease NurA [Halosimplex pelagicum]